jgi:23S rRNA pseudouridine2605 synthase
VNSNTKSSRPSKRLGSASVSTSKPKQSKVSKPMKEFKSQAKPTTVSSAQASKPSTPVSGSAERIQKVLAREGFGSRRELEQLILEGRVTVNGEVAKLGDKVSAGDRIFCQGRQVIYEKSSALPQILVYHKPPGEICSQKDPEERPSVFDRLPSCPEGRWVMVGRLDFNSSGLLMFTNSGELANQLMHPKYAIEREYAVRVFGELSEEHMDRLLKGVRLEDGMARFEKIMFAGGEGKNHWYHVVLKEGRNREIRRMFEAVGFTVSRLMRIRFGTVALPPTLLQGKRALLPDHEIIKLMDLVGGSDRFTA